MRKLLIIALTFLSFSVTAQNQTADYFKLTRANFNEKNAFET